MNNNLELNDLEDLFLNFLPNDILLCKIEVNVTAWISSYTKDLSWKLMSEFNDNVGIVYHFENKFNHFAELIIFQRGYISLDINGQPALFENISKIKGSSIKARYFNYPSGDEITIN